MFQRLSKISQIAKNFVFKIWSEISKKQFEKEIFNKLRSSHEEEDKEIIINEKNYHVECTIKYLHSFARFIVKNLSTNLLILKSSRKFTKFAVNKKLTRIFCEITKDFASNKIWRKNHHKIVIENFAFLLLLNKKSLKNLTQKISSITQRDVFYHYTNVFQSRITQEKIWFTKELNISEKRFQRAQHVTRTHWTWKVQAQTEYETACRKYLNERINWEYDLMKCAYEIFELTWLTTYDKEKMLRASYSFRINKSEDVCKTVEMNDFL